MGHRHDDAEAGHIVDLLRIAFSGRRRSRQLGDVYPVVAIKIKALADGTDVTAPDVNHHLGAYRILQVVDIEIECCIGQIISRTVAWFTGCRGVRICDPPGIIIVGIPNVRIVKGVVCNEDTG